MTDSHRQGYLAPLLLYQFTVRLSDRCIHTLILSIAPSRDRLVVNVETKAPQAGRSWNFDFHSRNRMCATRVAMGWLQVRLEQCQNHCSLGPLRRPRLSIRWVAILGRRRSNRTREHHEATHHLVNVVVLAVPFWFHDSYSLLHSALVSGYQGCLAY